MKKLFSSSILTFTCHKSFIWVIECLILSAILSFSITTFAQAPEKMNYQGVARDGSGNILADQSIGLEIKIHSSSGVGPIVYDEIHTTITNQFGLFNIQIGTGNIQSGTFSNIDWGNDEFYIETLLDPNGGNNFTSLGIQQLVSVPYALYAKNSGTPGPTGLTGLPGETGPTGPVGETGEMGLPGSPGEIGPTGPTGEQGMQGATGATGFIGPTGLNGVTGSTGPTGENGAQGAIGPTGPTGVSNMDKPQCVSYGPPYGDVNSTTVLLNIYSDRFALLLLKISPRVLCLQLENKNHQQFSMTSTYFSASAALIGDNLYILMSQNGSPDIYSLYKFNADNIALGGTLMAFSGLNLTNTDNNIRMTSDGTDIFFSYNAGNSINSYDIAKYSLSGNTLVFQETIYCSALPNTVKNFLVHSSGDIFISTTTDNKIYRFDQLGSLINIIDGLIHTERVWNWDDTFYFSEPNDGMIYTRYYYEE